MTAADRRATALYRTTMRTKGFQDGLTGRPKANAHPDYLASYRRGRERRGAVEG